MASVEDDAPVESGGSGKENEEGYDIPSPSKSVDGEDFSFDLPASLSENDPDHLRNQEIIASSTPTTELELALKAELDRHVAHNELLTKECAKMRAFVAKRRKQTYKRKRKDEGAPRKKLSGYNLFVKERFAQIKRENEEALINGDSAAELKRVAPASNIASSGKAWSMLSDAEKARYNAMAKPDEHRFEQEAAVYRSPSNRIRKRPVSGYNVFFSEYVRERKENGREDEWKEEKEEGMDKRGTVARIVGEAWKALPAQRREEYERRAEERNEAEETEGAPEEEPALEDRPITDVQHMDGYHTAQHAIMDAPRLDAPPEGRYHSPRGPYRPPPPIHHGAPPNDGRAGPDPRDGELEPPPPRGMPPPYPPEYPPPVIHQTGGPPGGPPGYEGYRYGPAPPYPADPYGYPPPHPGYPPPTRAEGVPRWAPPHGGPGAPPPLQGHPPPPPPTYQRIGR